MCTRSPAHAIPVNYLQDEAEVEQFFLGAHDKLYPGGVLMFDLCTPYYYQTVLGDGSFAFMEEDSAYILQTMNEQSRCRMLLTLFILQRNGLYARSEEEHVLTAFSKTGAAGTFKQQRLFRLPRLFVRLGRRCERCR